MKVLEHTKDNNKPDDYDIGNDYDYSSSKEDKKAAKNIKKYYAVYDYETLISKYKGENKSDKVLSLYDEVIRIEPDHNYMRQQKAEYLFNIDKNEEAIVVLNEILANRPYDGTIYELLGDIYFDMKDNENALKYFNLAKKHGASGGGAYDWLYGGNTGGVDEKIDKISGQKQLKNKFNTKSFEEMIADESKAEIITYPNPAQGEFNANIHLSAAGEMHARIYNSLGQTVMTQSYEGVAGFNTIQMNTMGMPNGFYLLELNYGDEHRVQKFVIEK